jgi:hypothetical protein
MMQLLKLAWPVRRSRELPDQYRPPFVLVRSCVSMHHYLNREHGVALERAVPA